MGRCLTFMEDSMLMIQNITDFKLAYLLSVSSTVDESECPLTLN